MNGLTYKVVLGPKMIGDNRCTSNIVNVINLIVGFILMYFYSVFLAIYVSLFSTLLSVPLVIRSLVYGFVGMESETW